MSEETLSDKIFETYGTTKLYTIDVKEFIKQIGIKVLANWKGQNEFVDWLKEKAGDGLI